MKKKIVIRYKDTKYSIEKIGTKHFQGVFNNISVQRRILNNNDQENDLIELLNAQETKKINLCDVRDNSGIQYGQQQFTHSKEWNAKNLKRGQVLRFSATVYLLRKLKSKNAQKVGPEQMIELSYPRNIVHTEYLNKSKLKPRVKDQLIDYRSTSKQSTGIDRRTELNSLIEDQVKDLLSEYDFSAATAAQHILKSRTRRKQRHRSSNQRK